MSDISVGWGGETENIHMDSERDRVGRYSVRGDIYIDDYVNVTGTGGDGQR